MKRDLLTPNRQHASAIKAKRPKQRSALRETPLTREESAARYRLQREAILIRSANAARTPVTEFDVPEHARALDAAIDFVRNRSSRTSARGFTYAPARARFEFRYSNLGRLFLVDPKTQETLVGSDFGCL